MISIQDWCVGRDMSRQHDASLFRDGSRELYLWKYGAFLNTAPWILCTPFEHSASETGNSYPLMVDTHGGLFTDSGLQISAEIQLLPEDAKFEVSEFHLYAEGFDTYCPMYAVPLQPGQLHPSRALLATTLPRRSSYQVTWVSCTLQTAVSLMGYCPLSAGADSPKQVWPFALS